MNFLFVNENFVAAATEWRFVQAGRLIEKKRFASYAARFLRFSWGDKSECESNACRRRALAQPTPELARDLNIDGCVSFTGFISQERLREIYYASHIFLHPSQNGR